jgi:hypothetical protein
MVAHGLDLRTLAQSVDRDEGVFGEHLRRLLLLLGKDPALLEATHSVLQGQPDLSPEAFYRLRAAGLLTGEPARSARPRCRIYETYLARHVL